MMNVARLVHPGFWFGKTPLEEALKLAKRGVGGFCLYGGTRGEITQFTKAVRQASPLPYLLISADYEDGLGRWVPDAPLLPSNMAIGAAGDENLAFEKGFLTALQARSLGVDWVFAPVLDLANNPLNPIVNTRAFGQDSQTVISLASAFIDGLKKGGALNSLKHFPGHGDTTTDSHLSLPVLHKTYAQLCATELVPFQALLAKADSVMAGHLLLPEIDPDFPASLSQKILKEILRRKMNYRGCLLTDALLMKAIGDEKQAALGALNAGADILLVPENPFTLIDFLEGQAISAQILSRSEKIQNELCTKAQQLPRPTENEAFAPSDLNRKTAQQAIVQLGQVCSFKPTDSVAYLEIGNTANTSCAPFLDVLRKSGIQVHPYPAQADHLIILCFRRYQAFQGTVTLQDKEKQLLADAAKKYPNVCAILFASPWALKDILQANTQLYTFSPAPEFQQQAAQILLGRQGALGTLPVFL